MQLGGVISPSSSSSQDEMLMFEIKEKKESKALLKQFPYLYERLNKALNTCTEGVKELNFKAEQLQKGTSYFLYKNAPYIGGGLAVAGAITAVAGLYFLLMDTTSFTSFLYEKGHNITQEVVTRLQLNNESDSGFDSNYTRHYYESYWEYEKKYHEDYQEEFDQKVQKKRNEATAKGITGLVIFAGSLVAIPSCTRIIKVFTGVDFEKEFEDITRTTSAFCDKQEKIEKMYQWGIKVAKFCRTWEKFENDSTQSKKLQERFEVLVQESSHRLKSIQLMGLGLLKNDITSHSGKELDLAELLGRPARAVDIIRDAFENEVDEFLAEMKLEKEDTSAEEAVLLKGL